MWIIILYIVSNIYYATAADSLACCPPGYYVSIKKHHCWNMNNSTVKLRLTCNKTITLNDNYNIISEQKILIQFSELHSTVVESGKVCVGNMSTKTKPQKLYEVALICLEEEEEKMIDSNVLGYCMAVSAIFLGLTVFVYCILSELRDLMGKSIINFCGSLGIGLATLSITITIPYADMTLCAIRGFLTYFFLIAAFFWTTAISIQVLVSTRQPAIIDGGWREFWWYALFAWGCPVIMTIILATVNYHPGSHSRPGIGLSHCWFLNKNQQWIYMYSVMSILIAVNIVIFIYTSTIVWRHSFASSHVKAIRYKFMTTVRLLVLMGLPWIFEMIGSLAEKHIIWVILDIFNTLQGILIFLLLVVFRKKVVKAMYKRGWLDCIAGPVEKYLAAGEDVEDNAIHHTDVPMNDRLYPN